MAVVKVTEIITSSKKSFEDAVAIGIKRSCKTLDEVQGAWIKEQTIKVAGGKISEYRVAMLVTFLIKD
jgi:flavin-binding protein dodecin